MKEKSSIVQSLPSAVPAQAAHELRSGSFLSAYTSLSGLCGHGSPLPTLHSPSEPGMSSGRAAEGSGHLHQLACLSCWLSGVPLMASAPHTVKRRCSLVSVSTAVSQRQLLQPEKKGIVREENENSALLSSHTVPGQLLDSCERDSESVLFEITKLCHYLEENSSGVPEQEPHQS